MIAVAVKSTAERKFLLILWRIGSGFNGYLPGIYRYSAGKSGFTKSVVDDGCCHWLPRRCVRSQILPTGISVCACYLRMFCIHHLCAKLIITPQVYPGTAAYVHTATALPFVTRLPSVQIGNTNLIPKLRMNGGNRIHKLPDEIGENIYENVTDIVENQKNSRRHMRSCWIN